MRRNSAGKILLRWRWITSSSDSQRVDLGAEREAGDRVDREAHQVGLQVDPGIAARGLLPAPLQALRDPQQRREVVP